MIGMNPRFFYSASCSSNLLPHRHSRPDLLNPIRIGIWVGPLRTSGLSPVWENGSSRMIESGKDVFFSRIGLWL